MSKPYINCINSRIPLDENRAKLPKTKEEIERIVLEHQIYEDYLHELKISKKEISAFSLQYLGITIPVSIFKSYSSTLELLVKYLIDVRKLRISEISRLLNRHHRTIQSAYQRTIKKNTKLDIQDSKINIPINVFSNRGLAPLEAIVTHLRDSVGLKLSQISILLARSPKTIWTVYTRAKKKNE